MLDISLFVCICLDSMKHSDELWYNVIFNKKYSLSDLDQPWVFNENFSDITAVFLHNLSFRWQRVAFSKRASMKLFPTWSP